MRRMPILLVAALLAAPLQGLAAQKAPAAAPAAAQATPATKPDSSRIVFEREVYRYPREGRRDPFASLIATGDVRPIFADLIVSGIMYDPTGRNSVAMLEDVSTGDLYRARVGSVFGRIRVTAIALKQVSVAIDEFGFTRQESLSLTAPSPATRTP
ncbi:MAG: hypothetical protein ACYC0B_08985 [Gemmatimonadaceae bacterium]